MTRWDDTRLFAFAEKSDNDYGSYDAALLRSGIGINHRDRDFYWQVRAIQRRHRPRSPTLNLSSSWRINDHWQASTSWQGDSDSTPVRAAEQNIAVRSANLAIRYQSDNGSYLRLAGQRSHFSDDNRRSELAFSAEQSLYSNAPHDLSFGQHLWSQHNNKTNTPYFSPDYRQGAQLHLRYRGDLYTRFDRRLTHQLTLGAGATNQADHGTAPLWSIGYEQTWTLGRQLSIGIGANLTRSTYDGNSETGKTLFANLQWRWR